jgi:hypothetical protein
MSSVDTRLFEPRSPGELFRHGVAECVRNGGAAWITAAAVLFAPTAIAVAGQYVLWRSGAADFMATMQGGNVNVATFDPGELLRAIALMAGIGIVTALLSLIAQYAAGTAVARMVAERALGRSFGPAVAWDFILGRAGKIIGGALAMILIVVAGAVAGEIPGGVIGFAIGTATGGLQAGGKPPAVMKIAPMITMAPVLLAVFTYLVCMTAATGVENLGGFGALGRSFRLVSGRFWHALGAVLLGTVPFILPAVALGGLMQTSVGVHLRESMGDGTATLVVTGASSVLSLLLYPFMMTIQVAIYFDLRSRQREESFTAYDLALDVGGELPEGVHDPLDEAGSWAPSSSEAASESPTVSDIS